MRSAIVYRCQPLAAETDFIGNDIKSSRGASADMCCSHCHWKDGYTGFSWSAYNEGTCWLKGGELTAIPGPGVTSARNYGYLS